MIQQKKDQFWLDHKGQKVPRQYVDAFDIKKETTVGRLIAGAEKLNAQIAAFKQKSFADADALYAEMMINANLVATERKGNYTLFSFDKSVKITVDVSDRIEFDSNITFAQEKINQFLIEKTTGADADLSVLVNAAFTTTKGRLDTKRILGLFVLKINHPLWEEAMNLIKRSIQTNSSVRYLSFYKRIQGDKYELVNLNFSNV